MILATSRNRPRASAFAPVAALLMFAGCGGEPDGPPAVPVSGTLSVEGKPVAQGTVHFHPEKGRTASGIVKDGKFTLGTYKDADGAVPGKAKVSVEVVEEVPTKDGDTTSRSLIAPKFADPNKSGLQLDIPPAGYSNLQINIQGNAASIKEG